MAGFRQRLDSVQPGDLLGPFDGRVVDLGTGKPLDSTTVLATWAFLVDGASHPGRTVTVAVRTDPDGRYLIAQLGRFPRGRVSVAFRLLAFRNGYLPYRSDLRFDGLRQRQDFVQMGNPVRLARLTPETTRAAILEFVGDASPPGEDWSAYLRELGREEGGTGRATATGAAPPSLLDARPLLSASDLRQTTGFTGEVEESRLGDLPRTSFYDSRHFRAKGGGERLDVALRVWRLPRRQAETEFGKLLDTLPAAEARDEVGDRSLRSVDVDALALAFLDARRGVLVQITCGRERCRDFPDLLSLARLVLGRIDKLDAAPALGLARPAASDAPGSTTSAASASPAPAAAASPARSNTPR